MVCFFKQALRSGPVGYKGFEGIAAGALGHGWDSGRDEKGGCGREGLK